MKLWVSLCFPPNREVDKVLSGLEILSKVFDQQSAFMVSKMIQQVCILASLYSCMQASSSVLMSLSKSTLLFKPR